MRFTAGLLVALASSAMGQLNSTTTRASSDLTTTTIGGGATTTSSGAGASSSAGPPVGVDLGDAILGPGASFVTLDDGSTAILLSPGPNGQASFALNAAELPQGVTVGDLIKALFDTKVEIVQNSRKRAATDCELAVTINGDNVYDEDLETSESFVQQTSGSTEAEDAQDIRFTQTCGAVPAALTVANLQVAAGEGDGGNGGGASTPGGTLTSGAPTGNGTTETGTSTRSAPTSTGSVVPGFPDTLGDFALFGCVGSSAGFPTFERKQSSGSMDLGLCAGLCDGRAFFGVHDTECYCGDEIDDANTSRVPIDQCDIQCPGDENEFCGGDRILQRRQAISNAILLTVYVSIEGAPVVTATVTSSSVITTTVTGASTTETKTVTAIYECFSGKCFPESNNGIPIYIFNPYPGADCDGQNVWVIESCTCKGGQQYVPKYCSGGDCNGLTVYKPEQCDDWYNREVVYCPSGNNGTVTYKPWEDTWGTPEHPVVSEVPTCTGSGCPVPSTSETPSGGDSETPTVVPASSAGKYAVSGVAYIAALVAAFL
ncbi:hypothetical protein CC79DRAFT_515192 [Sarocladium strictum]